MSEVIGQLCWECKNTNADKCPWFVPKNPQPVEGWTAIPTYSENKGHSYLILECPKFEQEEWRDRGYGGGRY